MVSISFFFYEWWHPYLTHHAFLIRTDLPNIHILITNCTQNNSDIYNARIPTPLWTRVRKLYSYEHLRILSRQIFKIDKVTTGTSLSTETSPTTEYATPLNLRIFALMGSRTQDLRCYRGTCIGYKHACAQLTFRRVGEVDDERVFWSVYMYKVGWKVQR